MCEVSRSDMVTSASSLTTRTQIQTGEVSRSDMVTSASSLTTRTQIQMGEAAKGYVFTTGLYSRYMKTNTWMVWQRVTCLR
jgi:hypothetical protein